MKMLNSVLSKIRTSSAGNFTVTLYDLSARESVTFTVAGEKNLTSCLRTYMFDESFLYNIGLRLAIVDCNRNGDRLAAFIRITDSNFVPKNRIAMILNDDKSLFPGLIRVSQKISDDVVMVDNLLDSDYADVLVAHCRYIHMRKAMRNYGYVVNPRKFTVFYDCIVDAIIGLRHRLVTKEAETP